jgi:hypothetical protein
MIKRIFLAAACVALLAPVASAQEAATLVLRSGERVSGQLIDHGGVGFTISVNGQNRTVPTGEVAVLEFGGAGGQALSSDAMAKLNAGQQVVMLRSGQTVAGKLFDISGKAPLKITFDAEGGRRDFTSSEISRIYLAPSGSGIGTTGAQAGEEGSIVVQANQQWTPTGITVRRGEVVNFQTSGEIRLSADPNDRAHSAGAFSQRRPAAGAPLPQEFAGALIARIDNGEPFAIGNNTRVTMPAGGQLFLGINDDAVGDNSSHYNVKIERREDRRRRR